VSAKGLPNLRQDCFRLDWFLKVVLVAAVVRSFCI